MPAYEDLAALPAGTQTALSSGQIQAALNISPRTFKTWLAEGRYPAHDLEWGGLHRWSLEVHNHWVATQRRKGV